MPSRGAAADDPSTREAGDPPRYGLAGLWCVDLGTSCLRVIVGEGVHYGSMRSVRVGSC